MMADVAPAAGPFKLANWAEGTMRFNFREDSGPGAKDWEDFQVSRQILGVRAVHATLFLECERGTDGWFVTLRV